MLTMRTTSPTPELWPLTAASPPRHVAHVLGPSPVFLDHAGGWLSPASAGPSLPQLLTGWPQGTPEGGLEKPQSWKLV